MIDLAEKRIVVIEDDVVNMSIMMYLLRQQSAQVFQDRWGSNAIENIRRALPIDLILLDLMFPRGISGFDIFAEIRSTPDLASIPIVAVSASDQRNRARDRGFDGYIMKPIDMKAFPVYLSKLLNGVPVWGED